MKLRDDMTRQAWGETWQIHNDMTDTMKEITKDITGDKYAAFDAFQGAVRRDHKNPEVQYNFGNFAATCMGDHQTTVAVECYKACLREAPDHANALNNYGALLISTNHKEMYPHTAGKYVQPLIDEAIVMLEKAEKLTPGYPAFNLGLLRGGIERNGDGCKEWMRVAYEGPAWQELPQPDELKEVEEFEFVLKEAWFTELLEMITTILAQH